MAEQWTPEGDTMWTDFLTTVFGDAATDIGGPIPYEPPAAQERPPVSFNLDMGGTGAQRSSSASYSGTAGTDAPALLPNQSSVQANEMAPLSLSPLSMPSNAALTPTPASPDAASALSPSAPLASSALSPSSPGALTQQDQPNVFQSTHEYTQNLTPPQAEEAPNNAHVQVMPDGTILLRIGGQWVPLGQPQQPITPQG